MDLLEDRLRGCLYGLAIGDALGAAVEFKAPGTFEPVTGYRAGGPHGLNPGEWTDDTSMALALADSIASASWDLDDQARRYVAWYQEGAYSVNGRCFDIGIQTRQALSRFEDTEDARTSASDAETASGNGSIMRLAPVVVAWAHRFPENVELLLERAEESSLPTHASPICRSACRYFALLLAGLANGLAREEVLSPDWSLLASLGPLHPAVQRVVQGSYREQSPPAIRGTGYVVASLEAALWAFHSAVDFREAVLRAVNLGEDADTTGAVCGQLAGAFWGESRIPPEWREGLARPDLVEAALAGLAGTRDAAPTAELRAPAVQPPARSYWLVPGAILAGCYPGSSDLAKRERRIQLLLDLGVRTFVDLTEQGERHHGRELAPYDDVIERLARAAGIEAHYRRFEIVDMNIPNVETMEQILQALEAGREHGLVYFHCLGGIGRTGTVAACWLLQHRHATGDGVIQHLAALRQMDRVRGQEDSPQTEVQYEFVQAWAKRLDPTSNAE